jgi:hypothetical protein
LFELDGGGVGEGRGFHICPSKMREVLARGGASMFVRARCGRCWRGEGVPYLFELDAGGTGEGRGFHICSSEIGEVLVRGGASIFVRARLVRCWRGEGVP